MTAISQGMGAPGLVDLIRQNLRLRAATMGPGVANAELDDIRTAASMFKTLGHETRLLILLNLVAGEKSVTELENILEARQPAVSQHLARLRQEGFVTTRRDGQTIHYSIKEERVKLLLTAVGTVFEGTAAVEK